MKNNWLKTLLWAVAAVAIAVSASGCITQEDVTAVKQKIVSGVITGVNKAKADVNARQAASDGAALPVSVKINGVEYQTNNAVIDVDGKHTGADALKTGMYVTLEATVDDDGTTGVASSISYDAEIVGGVLANNFAVDKTLNVLGQTVHIDDNTVLDTDDGQILTVANIAVGTVVEVSGYKNNTGDVFATRVEVKNAAGSSTDDEVEGVIASVDTANQTFVLGGLTIDYSTALFEHGIADNIAAGIYVEVHGAYGLDGQQRFQATKVEIENGGLARTAFIHGDASDNSSKDYELEGIITASLANGLFEVNGEKIIVPASVKIEHGNSTSLINDARVEVYLTKNADNNWVAVKVELRGANSGDSLDDSDDDEKNDSDGEKDDENDDD